MLSCLFALAIILQGAVLQAHIHTPLAPSDEFTVAAADAATSAPDQSADKSGAGRHIPAKGDPVNCFYCQQLKLAGSTILPPAAVLVRVEHATVVERTLPTVLPTIAAISHAWQSRGPPVSI